MNIIDENFPDYMEYHLNVKGLRPGKSPPIAGELEIYKY